MSSLKIYTGMTSVTSLPVLGGGPLLSGLRDGQTLDLSGLEAAPAPHLARRVKGNDALTAAAKIISATLDDPGILSASLAAVLDSPMTDTYGQISHGSSESASLQSSLGSRLRAATDGRGSRLCKLTWKEHHTPWGAPMCALRASARPTGDSASGLSLNGWPTPLAADSRGRAGAAAHKLSELPNAATLAGWATPDAALMNDAADPVKHMERLERLKVKHNNSNGAGLPIGQMVHLAGWATPVNNDAQKGPETQQAKRERGAKTGYTLHDQTAMVGPARLTASGRMLTGSTARMESGGRLNPRFSLWLMGYPAEWASCGERAMQSFRK